MKRREFITLLGGMATTWPLAARAQPSRAKVWRIGILFPGAPSGHTDNMTAFTQGLRELGYIDGKNVNFEHRFADGALGRLPALAAELVRANVDAILAEFFVRGSGRAASNRENPHRHDRRWKSRR